ncbi:MAG: molybdopterin-guanine dinucleotide biosynthesis protein B [Thermodesulfobacteriota bacterium]|nr:molybdopterin-guanine dinucleotide biosynthesis protein B [Thermodesulfobacteriota bacterium]
MPPIISIVGKSGSGKTTLIEKIIPELKRRGHKIGTVKHAYHGFDIDQKGKDSWRHKEAGADMVIVASPGKIAMVKDVNSESLECLEEYFNDMDIIIVEGYKREKQPKIEILRSSTHKKPLCGKDNNLIALVTDANIDLKVPKFGLEEIDSLVDFIEKNIYEKK